MQSLPHIPMHAWTHSFLSRCFMSSVLTKLTKPRGLDNLWWEEQTAVSHIPEESLFLADEMNGQMPSVKWGLAFSQRLGALARKGPPGDHGVLEAHRQDRVVGMRGE